MPTQSTSTSSVLRASWLALPLVVVLGLVLVWPLLTLAVQSFTTETSAFTLERYADVLTSRRYLGSLAVTAVLASVSTLLALLICVPAGLYISADKSVLGKLLAIALSIPMSLPGIVIGFFVILLIGNTGVVPMLFETTTGQRHLQLAYTWTGLTLGYLYFQIPRVVLVVRGAADGVGSEIVASARTLGANTTTIYRSVILPALRPAIASASVLAFATAFGAYGTAATLARGQRVMPLEIAAAFTDNFQPGTAATLSLILATITTSVLVGINAWGNKKVVSSRP